MEYKNQELELKKDDFVLNFEITDDTMEMSGDFETLTTIKTITKVTQKSTCTCACTFSCGWF